MGPWGATKTQFMATTMVRDVGVRGSLERDISSLRACGPGGRKVLGVVRVSARALFSVFGGK